MLIAINPRVVAGRWVPFLWGSAAELGAGAKGRQGRFRGEGEAGPRVGRLICGWTGV